MAAERNFWQVLVVTAKNGVHTRVLEYPTRELAEETIDACEKANEATQSIFIGGFRLYPEA